MIQIADDPYDLQRFLDAQAPVYELVLRELQGGYKRSHWMWFIFPQLAGLGNSGTAKKYAISSLKEARAYLNHPVLSVRLIECVELVTAVKGKRIDDILGYPDNLKFRSCLTLFLQVAPGQPVLKAALNKYHAGAGDPETLRLLSEA